MTKAKHFILYLMAVMLAVGIAGCKKESEEVKQPTPQDKPTPGPEKPDKPDDGKTDLYQEAFESMRQTHDYNKLVEDLVEAANANVDSANLSLAYMYEYGVGVEQDIAKAKSYYAKEAALNSNEFALDKSKMLGSGNFNYEIVLPEDCDLNMKDVVVLSGDSLSFANGDGTFNSSSDVVLVKNMQDEYVNVSYRHPSNKGKIQLSPKETALTLLLCTVPYGLNMSDKGYESVRKILLGLPETDQMAADIEKQLNEKGCFDIESLSIYIVKVYDYMYNTYGNKTNAVSKSFPILKSGPAGGGGGSWGDDFYGNGGAGGGGGSWGEDETPVFSLDDGKGHQVSFIQGNVQNDITTSIKSGNYNTTTNSWDLVLKVENLGQSCFMAVPGSIDLKTNAFVSKYEGFADYYLNATFVDASKYFDLGGGSFFGFVEVQYNLAQILWGNITSDRYTTDDDWIPFVDDVKQGFNIMADTYYDYRKKYLKVKEDIPFEVTKPLDALEYVYPYDDPFVGAYYLIYYMAIPVWEFYCAEYDYEFKTDNFGLRLFTELFSDKDWIDSFMEAYKKIFYTKEWGYWDDKSRKFYYNTLLHIYDVLEGVQKDIAGDANPAFFKYGTKYGVKSLKTGVKLYEKYSSVDDDEDWDKFQFAVAKEGEKWVLSSCKPLKELVKPVLTTITTGESLVTLIDGIAGMSSSKYRTFDVRFSVISNIMELSYHPIENVTNGTPAELVVGTTKKGTISIYADDKLLASEDDVVQLKYDLSVLAPGAYKITVQCVSSDKAYANGSNFLCNVHPEEAFLSFELDKSSVTKDEILNVSVSTNRRAVVYIYVDDKQVGYVQGEGSVELPTSVLGLHKGKIVVNNGGKVEEQVFNYTVEKKPVTISDLKLSASVVKLDTPIRGFVSTSEDCDFTATVVIDGVLYGLEPLKANKYYSIDLPTDHAGEIEGWVTIYMDGEIVGSRPFTYNVVSLKITDLTLTGNSIEQDDYFILSGKVTETCDIAVYVGNVLVSTIKNNSEFYVTMPTDKVGKVSGMIKTKLFDIENEQSFSYTVLPKPTETDASVTPSLPNVSGSKLENDGQASGTAPGVKGQDVNQTYNGSGSAPDVKGENLDQIYNGSGSAPDVKGTNL